MDRGDDSYPVRPKRFGRIDAFCWIPVVSMVTIAALMMVSGAAPFGIGLIAFALLLLLFDSWVNRPDPEADQPHAARPAQAAQSARPAQSAQPAAPREEPQRRPPPPERQYNAPPPPMRNRPMPPRQPPPGMGPRGGVPRQPPPRQPGPRAGA